MMVREHTREGVTVVELSGRLDTTTSEQAELYFEQLRLRGVRRLLVNLAGLEYITSAGLRVLIMTGQALDETGGQLRLCCLNPTVQQVFDISGSDVMFQVYAGEADALEGL